MTPMSSSIDRYCDLFERQGRRFIYKHGVLWTEYGHMVVPVGPAVSDYSISRENALGLLESFNGCLMVRTTSGFQDSLAGADSWYSVISPEFIDLSLLSSNTRNQVRRGLKNCSVDMIDADYVANNGFNVLGQAYKRYKNLRFNLAEQDYKRDMEAFADYSDIVHFWGIFFESNLIAYCINYVYGATEVNYANINFDPDYLRLYPSYALIYSMNRHYLDELGFDCVNDGHRSLLHETNIQDYLIQKFHFQKAPMGLSVVYRPSVSAFLSVSYPFRSIGKVLHPKLKALFVLEELRRKSQANA